ncbi:hypothetical protein B7494_g475 [Chlorociboria aeruginascens]|nr:hypothetical protein B7494_g475 [Chlorociboria aeruginascens]
MGCTMSCTQALLPRGLVPSVVACIWAADASASPRHAGRRRFVLKRCSPRATGAVVVSVRLVAQGRPLLPRNGSVDRPRRPPFTEDQPPVGDDLISHPDQPEPFPITAGTRWARGQLSPVTLDDGIGAAPSLPPPASCLPPSS